MTSSDAGAARPGGAHPQLGPPLAGVRVLDLSQVMSGPLCGRALADLGAEVIKVEAPHGDITRTVPPFVDGNGLYFTHVNAGKRGITIDLRNADGAALVRRMALRCDVLLENFRPGVLARRGLGADELLAEHPRLVYCSITGWGQDGPWAQRRAYAPLVHAQAGRIELAARLRHEPPRQEVHVHADIYTSFAALSAILAALVQRDRTGYGQHLDVAMADALLYTDEWASTDLAGYPADRVMDIWNHVILPLADGSSVTLVGSPVRMFDRWVAALGGAPVERPADDVAAAAHVAELVAKVPDYQTFEVLLENEPMLVAEVRSVAQLADTDWARERDVFVEIRPGARIVRSPFRSRHADVGVVADAPLPDQHTDEVLRDLLHLDDAAIAALHASGAVR
jgi:CoA:oxalate CoA-transferase